MAKFLKNYLPIFFFGIVLSCVQVQAAPFNSIKNDDYYKTVARNTITLDEAVIQIKRRTDGRILTAETVTKRGKRVHRIKVLLQNGNVKVFYVEAE